MPKKKLQKQVKSESKVNWHTIDAGGKVLGKVAVEVSNLLVGKHKVDYVPYKNCGDKVVVINAKEVVLTGQKESQKMYRRSSRMLGKLKEKTAEQVRAQNPNRMIYDAVKGMLPKNKLRRVRLANLKVYEGEKK